MIHCDGFGGRIFTVSISDIPNINNLVLLLSVL